MNLLLAALIAGVGPYTLSPPDTAGRFDAPPVLSWKVPLTGAGSRHAAAAETSAPVLVGDRIYVGASSEDALLVLDRRDGHEIMRLPALAPVRTAPLVLSDRVIFVDGGGGYWCYPLAGGAPIWKHEMGAPVLANPVLHNDRLFIANLGNTIASIKVSSGEVAWFTSHVLDASRDELALFASPQPVVNKDLVYFGFSDGAVAAYSLDKGELVWQRVVGEGRYPDIAAPILILGDDAVVAGFNEPIIGLDLRSGAVRWRLDQGLSAAPIDGGGLGDAPDGQFRPEVAERFVYLPGNDGVLRCLDVTTGLVRWEFDTQTESALVRPVPSEAGLVIASTGGGLFILDPVSGKERWRWEPGYLVSGISAPPAIEGRQMVVVTNVGDIASFVVPRPEPAQVDRSRPDSWLGPVTR